MTAVASPGRMRNREMFDKLDCTLYPAAVAFPNARAVAIVEAANTSVLSGTLFRVKPAESGDTNSGHFDLGTFEISHGTSVTGAASVGSKVTVNLGRHVEIEWWITGDALSSYSFLGLAYGTDDQTVTSTASTNPIVGRVWGAKTVNGVKLIGVERLQSNPGTVNSYSGAVRTDNALTVSYTSNDYAPTAAEVNAANGSVSTIDAPGANSTITLPTTGVTAGTVLHFTKPVATATYTVSVREGSTNLWTLTANKRGACTAIYDGTAWGVVGTSAP